MSSKRKAVINLSVQDRGALAACYMPFLGAPGFFVPTKRKYELGDEVFLLTHILEYPSFVPLVGKVVWITPVGSQGNRDAGVGVQIEGSLEQELQNLIDTQLAAYPDGVVVSHTM